jgi:hypothetical protein
MSDQPISIRTNVPPSMHPDALANLSDTLTQKDTLGINIWNVAREALGLCYQSYTMLNDTEKSVKEVQSQRRMVDGRPTEVAATSKELANAAEASWKRIAPIIDRKVKELNGTLTVISNRVAAAIDEPTRKTAEGIALATEVRNYVRALPLEQRTAFVNQAINEGDKSTVAALLHAQPFLSGLTPLAHSNMRKQAAAKFAPLDSAQHDAATTAIEYVMQAGSALSARYGKVMHSMRQTPVEKAADQLKALAGG